MEYFSYAYDFLKVEFKKETEPPVTPSPVLVIVNPAKISLDLTCTFTTNGMIYNCTSIKITQLQGRTCTDDVTFSYCYRCQWYAVILGGVDYACFTAGALSDGFGVDVNLVTNDRLLS